MNRLREIDSKIKEIEEQIHTLDNLKEVNTKKLKELMNERHDIVYYQKNIDSKIKEIEEQIHTLDNLKEVNTKKLKELMNERHDIVYHKKNEDEKLLEKVADNLHNMWHKTGGFDYIGLVIREKNWAIFKAEKHENQLEYLIHTDKNGEIKKLYEEEN